MEKQKKFEDILFEIVLTSNPDMIVRAHQIDKECMSIPTEINVYIYQSEMTDGMKAAMGENPRSREIKCPVIGHNPYKMTDRYLIQTPNGSTRWVGNDGR